MATLSNSTLRPATVFELEALESLPCGCVASAHRSRLLGLMLISLEAKGPYCRLAGHFVGQTLRLGDPIDSESDDGLHESHP